MKIIFNYIKIQKNLFIYKSDLKKFLKFIYLFLDLLFIIGSFINYLFIL